MFGRFSTTDANGNSVVANNVGQIFLKLASEDRERKIGQVTLNAAGAMVYTKHEKMKDVFRKTMSWGLNWWVLSNLGEEGIIKVYSDDARLWIIKASEAKEKGSFLHFKNQGIEKRFYIPLKEWRVFKA